MFYISKINAGITETEKYRFEVTMDNLLPVQHLQAPQKSMGEPTNESETKALEVVFFDELVQVHPEDEWKWIQLFLDAVQT